MPPLASWAWIASAIFCGWGRDGVFRRLGDSTVEGPDDGRLVHGHVHRPAHTNVVERLLCRVDRDVAGVQPRGGEERERAIPPDPLIVRRAHLVDDVYAA